MRGATSILPVVPLVAFPVALVLPFLISGVLSPAANPQGFAVAFQVYHVSLLIVWLLTVALTSIAARRRTIQFTLKGLLGFVAAAAIGLAASVNGSVFSYAVVLMLTVGCLAWCLYVAVHAQRHERAFCCGFFVLGCLGVLCSLFAPTFMTGTPLVKIMLWDLTIWGNGLGWNAASFLGCYYLFLTWLAAYSGGWLASSIILTRVARP